MTERRLRVFITASHVEMREELAAAKDAVMKMGCEPVTMESWLTEPGPRDSHRTLEELRSSDLVVALLGNRPSDFMLDDLRYARNLRLPLLCFVKRSADAEAVLPPWLTSGDAPVYSVFDNTPDLQARILESLAMQREKSSRNSEADSGNTASNDSIATEHEATTASPGAPASAPGAPPPHVTEGTQPQSVLDALGDPKTLRIMKVLGTMNVAAEWTKRRAGALFILGVMALVSYVWWSKSRIETPTAQTPAASNADQATQQSLPYSFGPSDYRNSFSDQLRGIPTTSGTMPGPGMLIIRAGTFTMGTDPQPGNGGPSLLKLAGDEHPAHEVNIARPFAIGLHEVDVFEYTVFAYATTRPMPLGAPAIIDGVSTAQTSSDGIPVDGRANLPVQNVSWHDATAYVNWLSTVTGARYRLPTEAEWELVAINNYQISTQQLDDRTRCETTNIQWAGELYECPDRSGPIPVAAKYVATLTDMIGNVAEWTADCYRPNYNDAPMDGSAVSSRNCPERVFRGGWWRTRMEFARPTFRAHAPPDFRDYSIGFRVVRELSDAEIAKLVDGPAPAAQEEPTQPTADSSIYPGVEVPDVMGMDEKAAIALLTQAGFDPRPSYKNVRDDSPAPVVISQSPEAGARTAVGATIELILTPPPRAIQPAPARQPATTPSRQTPRELPPNREDQTSNDYEANPPQQQQQLQLPQESPPQQQQQQQQQLPTTTGKDPASSEVGEPPAKQY